MHALLRIVLAIAPLLATLLFAWLTMESYLNLGGGEKDVFLTVPLLLWSLIYLFSFLALWWRHSSAARAVAVSSGLATGAVVMAWAVLFGVSWLKFR